MVAKTASNYGSAVSSSVSELDLDSISDGTNGLKVDDLSKAISFSDLWSGVLHILLLFYISFDLKLLDKIWLCLYSLEMCLDAIFEGKIGGLVYSLPFFVIVSFDTLKSASSGFSSTSTGLSNLINLPVYVVVPLSLSIQFLRKSEFSLFYSLFKKSFFIF